jgi:CheY-like chemotaxis protein
MGRMIDRPTQGTDGAAAATETWSDRVSIMAAAGEEMAAHEIEKIIIVFESRAAGAQPIAEICRAMGVRVLALRGERRLLEILHYLQPVAVVADCVMEEQDGFDVMKVIACYNRQLPMLMLTNGDHHLAGAAEAVAEIWHMTDVTVSTAIPTAHSLRAFLNSVGLSEGRAVPPFVAHGRSASQEPASARAASGK